MWLFSVVAFRISSVVLSSPILGKMYLSVASCSSLLFAAMASVGKTWLYPR